jgi:hypothetical protein
MNWQYKILLSPSQARILEYELCCGNAAGRIDNSYSAMGGMHVVNCPFFDTETLFERKSKQFGQQPQTTS